MTDRPRVRGRARRAGEAQITASGPDRAVTSRRIRGANLFIRKRPNATTAYAPLIGIEASGERAETVQSRAPAGQRLAGRHAPPAGSHRCRDRARAAHFGRFGACDAENPAREGASMTDAKPPTNPREACRARSPLCPPRATDPRRPRRGPPGGASHRPSGRRKRPATPLGSPPRPSPQDPGTHPAKRAADPELKDLRRTLPWRYDRRADISQSRLRPRPPDPPPHHPRLVNPPPQRPPDGPG